MNKLQQYLYKKDIALIGNAKNILNSEKNIDKYEIIVRINKGFPRDKEKFIGQRTDILALSLPLSKEVIEKEYNPKYIIWFTPKRQLMNDYLKKVAYLYSLSNWEKLFDKLKARPSTGCMVIDYLTGNIDFNTLTIYGFDFWSSPTWYTDKIHIGNHNPKVEKDYIQEKIQEYQGKIKWENTN